ncbi:hypothetical protein IG631_06941 [Alternaria alternata]|nr:hypothetical protein IG631_06941 [Alternaria alternata]
MPVAYAEALGQSLATLPHAQDHHPVSSAASGDPKFQSTPNKSLKGLRSVLWLFPIQKRRRSNSSANTKGTAAFISCSNIAPAISGILAQQAENECPHWRFAYTHGRAGRRLRV